MLSEVQRLGPQHTAAGHWSQVVVNAWCPENARARRGPLNDRLRFYWPGQSMSRSWARWGYPEAALTCLRSVWEWHTWCTGQVCDMPGIMPTHPPGSVASSSTDVVAAPSVARTELAEPVKGKPKDKRKTRCTSCAIKREIKRR